MKFKKVILIALVFLLGFLSSGLVNLYFAYSVETPSALGYFGFIGSNKSAPSDFIKENQIEVYPDKVVLNIAGASLSRYASTGSMIPVFDQGANGIRIKPQSEKDIHVGDIITFKQDNYMVVHRVIEIGTDQNGTYFITKGDNNSVNDGKVRFSDISYITIGVIY
jgi:signal peptidase I